MGTEVGVLIDGISLSLSLSLSLSPSNQDWFRSLISLPAMTWTVQKTQKMQQSVILHTYRIFLSYYLNMCPIEFSWDDDYSAEAASRPSWKNVRANQVNTLHYHNIILWLFEYWDFGKEREREMRWQREWCFIFWGLIKACLVYTTRHDIKISFESQLCTHCLYSIEYCIKLNSPVRCSCTFILCVCVCVNKTVCAHALRMTDLFGAKASVCKSVCV